MCQVKLILLLWNRGSIHFLTSERTNSFIRYTYELLHGLKLQAVNVDLPLANRKGDLMWIAFILIGLYFYLFFSVGEYTWIKSLQFYFLINFHLLVKLWSRSIAGWLCPTESDASFLWFDFRVTLLIYWRFIMFL